MKQQAGQYVTRFAVDHPWVVTAVMIGSAIVLAVLAAAPTLWPDAAPGLNPARIDTDPENMLAHDEPVRVFHDQMKKTFTLWDMVVVGVVNEQHPQGVFNLQTLERVHELTEFAKTLQWDDPDAPGGVAGVVEPDMIAPSMVDNIEQGEPGEVRFSWLMRQPPDTQEQAVKVREAARDTPFLNGTLVSEDGEALAIYLPLTSKDVSYDIYQRLLSRIESFGDVGEEYHITGLPVAEDTFGVEMFYQMAISAPLAMAVIFVLMWWFFRKLSLIVPPMIIAMVCAISTMALLVISGQTIHIMSSMIPIFIMPIAVLDAIHVISDFFDRYAHVKDRRETMLEVMDTLFMPMLFTSLTTTAGFASLALTPIPPVQVFGIFVAVGVMLAWWWTITFVPAAAMLIPERWLASLTADEQAGHTAESRGWMRPVLHAVGRFTHDHAGKVLIVAGVLVVVAIYGISQIRINDNPTKWFEPDHPIRVADRVLNDHFGGTYMAYLQLAPPDEPIEPGAAKPTPADEPASPEDADGGGPALPSGLGGGGDGGEGPSLPAGLGGAPADSPETEGPSPDQPAAKPEIFKQPEVLRYIADLQEHLLSIEGEGGEAIVGKSNSLADIVKTVHRELFSGEEKDFRIPDGQSAVAQVLFQFQNSHRPDDLWHFATPDYRRSSTWVQLTSGDNRDMSRVAREVEDYIARHPIPAGLEHRWFGLTYINVVWQDKMVSGMLQAFLGSFLVVLLMMIVLFRSALWGLLSMIPLTLTVGLIYGIVGLIGKDYDMPVAVLSSLSLGLAVDYAIHFLARSRYAYERHGSWREAVGPMFGEPARAITRNAIVVGVGFLPLLAAPLMPYKTVGTFIALILITAGLASLLVLPAMITLLERWLFPSTNALAFTCRCGTCIVSAAAALGLVAVNLHQFMTVGWTEMTWLSIGAIVAMVVGCWFGTRREQCRAPQEFKQGEAS